MTTKLELDYKRVMIYQSINNNLNAVTEYFRHGDLLIKEVNSYIENIQLEIDNNGETSFSKQDFNDILDIRNNVLFPIFQNASFAQTFDPYVIDPSIAI